MSHTVLLVFTFQLFFFPLNDSLTTAVENRLHDVEGDSFQKQVTVQPVPALLALQDQASPGKQQKSGRRQKGTTETKKGGKTSSRQGDKKSSPKGFVPSEKIKADKAVDFPADI